VHPFDRIFLANSKPVEQFDDIKVLESRDLALCDRPNALPLEPFLAHVGNGRWPRSAGQRQVVLVPGQVDL
jgi:hypothetical protein